MKGNKLMKLKRQAETCLTNSGDKLMKTTIAVCLTLAAVLLLALSLSALAQDAFNSTTAPGNQANNGGDHTGSQTDATFIQGIRTASTVCLNNQANSQASPNIIAKSVELPGIPCGGPEMRVLFGSACVTGGQAVPDCIKRLVVSARAVVLFS